MGSPFTPMKDRKVTALPARMATEGQKDYLRSLMLQKAQAKGMDTTDAMLSVDQWLEELTFQSISHHIDQTKAWLAENVPAATVVAPRSGLYPEVPAGKYALDTEDDATNGTAFYQVDRPTEGRWAGRVFVKMLVGGDEQRLAYGHQMAVLAKITAVGAEAASARYGQDIGRCGICNTRLTNDDSRARGIGPVCAEKAGW